MCCNSFSKSAPANNEDSDSVHVNEVVVATPLPDGYWLCSFPFSTDAKFPDLIGYGLGFQGKPATIRLFMNPKNTNSVGWGLGEIQSLDFPVATVYADLTGNGYNDLIITDRYGPNMGDLWDGKTNNGGRIQWLRNPGDRSSLRYWEAHHIGNSTGMHRIQVGHFTSQEHVQVMGFPIIRAAGDLTSPAPVILYTPVYGSDSGQGPERWSEAVIFPSQFRLIHEAKAIPNPDTGLDMVLIAGREGIVSLWYSPGGVWQYNVIGTGLPIEAGNPYWGSGFVDVARVRDDSVGYIPSCEAFHGNTVAVYLKNNKELKGVESLKDCSNWMRVVIDRFGPLDAEQHVGTIHHVVSVKVGNSDIHSFAVACMGAPIEKPENQGVYLYIPVDLSQGQFRRIKITEESAGRLAMAGFVDPNRLDIASISYYVPGYHTGPDPPSVRINTLEPSRIASRTAIFATKLNKEVLLRVPRPNAVPDGHVPTMPLITLAGKKLSLVVLPPRATIQLHPKDGVKIVYGKIEWADNKGNSRSRIIATIPKEIATTLIVSEDGSVTAGGDGAVFLRVETLENYDQGPYRTMNHVTTTNLFPRTPHVEPSVRAMEFPFLKVEMLDWANTGSTAGHWKDFEFYNMTGFYVYFNDDAMEEVVHIQAWTLGIGETARFHNHSDKSFCEIHYCLYNGGGDGEIGDRPLGGMRYFEDSYTEPVDPDAELTKDYVEDNSTLLAVPSMYEHGPLWKIQPGSFARPELRPNDTVDYSWHAWLASRFGDYKLPIIPSLTADEQSYDIWLAFEFPPSAFQF